MKAFCLPALIDMHSFIMFSLPILSFEIVTEEVYMNDTVTSEIHQPLNLAAR